MKKLIFLIILAIFVDSLKAAELSDSLKISLLTVSPGAELYSTFGHTAIRVVDLKNQHDIVFNYGTFNFRTPHFYLKFALGLLDYQLSIESFEDFRDGCYFENRSVVEQELNLDKDQQQRLAYLLIENFQPENRKYRYKFFTDNCSTRPRDIISQAVNDSSILEKTKIKSAVSFRDLFTSYLTQMPWSRFGIELLMGTMTDKQAGYDALFLPDNLKSAVEAAVLNGKPLEKKEEVVLENQPFKVENSIISPVLIGILLVLISIFIQLKNTWSRIFDQFFFMLFGFLGLFITVLSLASHHEELHTNLVMLLFFPAIILIPFFREKGRKNLALISFAVILLVFITMPLLPQSFNPAVLLISFAVAVRCFFNFAKISNKRIHWL